MRERSSVHPPPNALVNFGAGLLRDTAACAQIAEHLELCSLCRQLVEATQELANENTKEPKETKQWIDFKEIKAAVTIEMVLNHYGVKLRQKGSELRGLCPIHKDEGKQKRSFTANTVKNCFNCYVCHAHGDVLDFVKAKEGCTLRDAGVKLSEWFGVGAGK